MAAFCTGVMLLSGAGIAEEAADVAAPKEKPTPEKPITVNPDKVIDLKVDGFESTSMMSSSDIAVANRRCRSAQKKVEKCEAVLKKLTAQGNEKKIAEAQDNLAKAKAGRFGAQALVDRIAQGEPLQFGAKQIKKPLEWKVYGSDIAGIKEIVGGEEKVIADLSYTAFAFLQLTFTGEKPSVLPTFENKYLCFHVNEFGKVKAHVSRNGELIWLSAATGAGEGMWSAGAATKYEKDGGSGGKDAAPGASNDSSSSSNGGSDSSSSSSSTGKTSSAGGGAGGSGP